MAFNLAFKGLIPTKVNLEVLHGHTLHIAVIFTILGPMEVTKET